MRIRRDRVGEIHEGDLTPMIDMTFQLIAFFMVLINFTQTEQDDRVKLPDSTLAKPPENPPDFPITLHVTRTGSVVIGGQEILELNALKPYLANEATTLELQNKATADATIIIRAHQDAATGKVQELIRLCQESNFEKFALRAKEDVGN
ncbi:MAG: biopolymer transporter ExbD [Pirellulaceae bacterium]|nr:biopolymer transporter ExbD [Pirellulaceae bacterium]